MTGWVAFEAQISPMAWGDALYTVLRIPGDIAADLTERGARRVEVEINDHVLNLALTKAPVIEGVFVYTGKAVLRQLGVEPGDMLEVRLRPVDPDQVDLPTDLEAALRAAERLAEWRALSPGKRRGLLHPVTSAKREATRAERIRKLIASL